MKTVIIKTVTLIALLVSSTAHAIVFSIEDGDVVTSPIVVSGNTEFTPGWEVFEGQVGSMTIVDSSGNIMVESPIQIDPSIFNEQSQDFLATAEFAVTDTSGSIIFENNAIGDDAIATSTRVQVFFEKPVQTLQIRDYQFVESNGPRGVSENAPIAEEQKSLWATIITWITFWK